MKFLYLIIVAALILPAAVSAAVPVKKFRFAFEKILVAKIVKGAQKKLATVAPVAGVPKNFLTHDDAKRKLRFYYPNFWTKVMVSDSDHEWLMELKTRHDGPNILGQLVVRVSKAGSYTQQTYNDFIKKTLESYGPKKDGEDYWLTYENFAGSKNVLHLKSTNSKSIPMYADTYAVVKNGYIYAFGYQSTDNDYSPDLPFLNQLLKSITIK